MDPPNTVYENKELLDFWIKQRAKIQQISATTLRELNRHQELPLTRIRKIIKIDDEIKSQMISAEVTMLLAKASEILIEELSLRSWFKTQRHRRKTIQKSDIAAAVSGNEMFDFLIDIVPRDEILKTKLNHFENEEFAEMSMEGETPQVQYIVQYNGTDSLNLSNSLMQLENGQIIQATQIGPSIPLSGNPGEPIQFMTMPTGQQLQILPVNSKS